MRFSIWLLSVAGVTGSVLAANERVVEAPVVSAGLFKNGLALVERQVVLSGPGDHVITNGLHAVHGTFWVESAKGVEVRSRQMERPEAGVPGERARLEDELSGRTVVLHFSNEKPTFLKGRVINQAHAAPVADFSRDYERRYAASWWGFSAAPRGYQAPAARLGWLVLQNDAGMHYINPETIVRVETGEPVKQRMVKKDVLVLSVPAEMRGKQTVRLKYLTKGLAWAPSYHFALGKDGRMHLHQKAIVRNELESLDGVQLGLISGFPNMPFSHVTYPMDPQTSWSTFFQQLGQDPRQDRGGHSRVLMQQAVMMNSVVPSPTPTANVPGLGGEGVDLFVFDAGKHSLALGESMVLNTVDQAGAFERVVAWRVPDLRDANGRYISRHERDQHPEKYKPSAWDAIRFKNPFAMPMTTAPALITEGGQFLGQQTSFWTSPKEEATLDVTKALNVRTRHTEEEEPGERKVIYVAGNDYQRTVVKSTLTLANHRSEDITMIVTLKHSGDLLEVTGDPQKVMLEEGAWAVNPRHGLTWTVTLKAGETRELVSRYALLVDR